MTVPTANGGLADRGGAALLCVESLTVTYGRALLAVRDVSLAVPERGAVALLGANGAGKTTVLRAVGGLLGLHGGRIAHGRIRFGAEEVTGLGGSALVARGIGQALEGRRVFPDLTVLDNLRVGAYARRARTGERRNLERVLDLFPALARRIDQRAGLLSGGEQQMLAIGRALMAQPRLLLLDEPSLGLAPLIVQQIGTALRRVVEDGTAVLLVDQSTALALRLSDYGYLLENGRRTVEGPTAALLAQDHVRASYLGMTAGGQELFDKAAPS